MFYWILEYGKVLISYLFIMYFWPSAVFRNYLRNKSLAFGFSFCSTVMILLLNTVVLMLGIVGLLNQWIIRVLFYGPLAAIFVAWIYRNRAKAIHIKYLLTDICSLKRFLLKILECIVRAVKSTWQKLLNKIRPHLMLCCILAVATVYGLIYFSYGAFHERYYGASDVYVHHSWIALLLEGQVFAAGVYPEGMHCLVYAMKNLCGVELYSTLLFLAGVHIPAFLLSVYLFFKEIFPWKYTGAFVVVLYLILRMSSSINLGGIARLQWTIPQEFGLYTVFLCAGYLLRFLRNPSAGVIQWKKFKFVLDENLLIFMMALAASVAIHFYVTIMAFFLCLAIGVFFIVSVFARKRVLPLVTAIVCGVLIAVIPMVTALASGIEFQGSINWAINVISDSQQAIESNKEKDSEKPSNIHTEDPGADSSAGEQSAEEEAEPSWIEKAYMGSFGNLYREDQAAFFAGCLLLGALLGLICLAVSVIKKKSAAVEEDPFCGYLFLIAAELIFMILFAAPYIGILEIVKVDRLSTMAHLLTLASVLIPLDLIMTLLDKRSTRLVMNISALLLCVGMVVSVVAMGEYHSHLYYVMTRYPAAAEVTQRIIRNMEPETYTIVSPVDELYQVRGFGFHEELVRFVHEITQDTYTLPTEYVFIFIEKQPLQYAQNHLLDGPAWLGNEEYLSLVSIFNSSQNPDVLHSEISTEEVDFGDYIPQIFNSYKNLTKRTAINSKAYLWAEQFREVYPYKLTTVYEDSAFVCYMFRQNPARLLDLAIVD